MSENGWRIEEAKQEKNTFRKIFSDCQPRTIKKEIINMLIDKTVTARIYAQKVLLFLYFF